MYRTIMVHQHVASTDHQMPIKRLTAGRCFFQFVIIHDYNMLHCTHHQMTGTAECLPPAVGLNPGLGTPDRTRAILRVFLAPDVSALQRGLVPHGKLIAESAHTYR